MFFPDSGRVFHYVPEDFIESGVISVSEGGLPEANENFRSTFRAFPFISSPKFIGRALPIIFDKVDAVLFGPHVNTTFYTYWTMIIAHVSLLEPAFYEGDWKVKC